jgi:uncharacterized protein YkwD
MRLILTGLFFLIACSRVQAQSGGAFVSMSYLTELEKNVLFELNRARTDPKTYAKHVKAMLKLYEGNLLQYPNEIAIMTVEGAAAARECYEFLMNAEPLDSLRPSRGLSLAAKDHAEDQGLTENIGHTGKDGSSPFDRVERYGQWLTTAGENIDYGNNDARRIVLSLLIDDGVSSRGHRTNIFNLQFKAAGIACGPHKKYGSMCVIDFAGGFKAKKSASVTRGED